MKAWVIAPLALSVLLLGCGAEEPPLDLSPSAESMEPAPRLGLWVLAEGTARVLEEPERIEGLIAAAERLGATDLFVQVYRGGRSWYLSGNADSGPHHEIVARHGRDLLPVLVEAAHAKDMRVHAWFNTLSLARNRDAPLLDRVGKRAVLVDRRGRSLLDYPGLEIPEPQRQHIVMGTPGVWLDPSADGVVEYLEGTLDDLLRAVPGLDGLHLDFIRHPMALPMVPGSRFNVGLDFGYGREARDRFVRETGHPFARGQAWDEYRRERVSDVVRRLHARLPESWEMSAAVLTYADRAYLTAMQDWRRWLEEGVLDFAVAMAYTKDDRLLRYMSHGLVGGLHGDRVWLGLGSWLFAQDSLRAQGQINIAREAKPSGVALFSYDALADAPEVLESLVWER